MTSHRSAQEIQERADARLSEALAVRSARDPREFYRERLRELRDQSADAYGQAVSYYRETLLPSIADGSAEPVAAWTEYGRQLAELLSPGRTVALDDSGRASPYEAPANPDVLVLHLPSDQRRRALVVALPAELSTAQRAAYDWLVVGRNAIPDKETS